LNLNSNETKQTNAAHNGRINPHYNTHCTPCGLHVCKARHAVPGWRAVLLCALEQHHIGFTASHMAF